MNLGRLKLRGSLASASFKHVLGETRDYSWFQLLDSEIMNAKVFAERLETIIGLPAESFERGMGKVDGGV